MMINLTLEQIKEMQIENALRLVAIMHEYDMWDALLDAVDDGGVRGEVYAIQMGPKQAEEWYNSYIVANGLLQADADSGEPLDCEQEGDNETA